MADTSTATTASTNAITDHPFTITSTSRMDRKIKMLLHGLSGSGKTALAGTAEYVTDMKHVFMIDAEAGDLTLINDNITRVEVTHYDQIGSLYQFLRRHCVLRDGGTDDQIIKLEQRFSAEIITKARRYNTVVIDSLTEIQRLNLYKISGRDLTADKIVIEAYDYEIRDWGRTFDQTMALIRAFRNLPMHVIVTAGTDEIFNKDGRIVKRRPLFAGKAIPANVGYQFDIIGYMANLVDDDGKGVFRLHLTRTSSRESKHRFGAAAPAYIDNPTMQKIYALMEVRLANKDKR